MRLAWRTLWRQPGFTTVAVLTLALGIGAATAIFSVANATIFRPASVFSVADVYNVRWVPGPRWMALRKNEADLPRPYPLRAEFDAFAAKLPDVLTSVSASTVHDVVLRVPGRAERTEVMTVVGDYADVLRLTPEAGRWVTQADVVRGDAVAVISERIWREWFERRRGAIGGRIDLNGRAFTIVGVAPIGFRTISEYVTSSDVWIPASAWTAPAADPTPRLANLIDVPLLVRARPGTTVAAVDAAMRVLFRVPAGDRGSDWTTDVTAESKNLRSQMQQLGFEAVFVAVLVLFAACANLANLMLVRATRREGEVATRMSLGATRRDIFRLFGAEATIISGLAVIVGFVVAAGLLWIAGLATGAFANESRRGSFTQLFANANLTPDWSVFVWGLVSGAAAALVVGVAAAWRGTRVTPARAIAATSANAAGTRRGRITREALVAVQVTAAVILLMITGIFLTDVSDTITTRVFLDTSHVTAARLDVSLNDDTETRGREFYTDLLAHVRQIPGVQSAAISDGLPGYAYVSSGTFSIEPERGTTGQPNERLRIGGGYAGVSDGFLQTIGLHVVHGREITGHDDSNAPPIVNVTESVAARLWPNDDPIGKRLMFGHEGVWRTVVGVVSDPAHRASDAEHLCDSCVTFVPWTQRYRPQMLVMVKSATPAAMVDPLKQAIASVDRDVAILEAAPIDDSIVAWVRPARATKALALILAVLALAIAGLGVYGIIAFLVGMRIREFGVRIALGATAARLSWMVVDHAIHLVLVGLLPGVLLATWGSRWLLVQNVRSPITTSLASWYVVPPLVLIVGVLAALVPARRAARVDPNHALRDL